MWIVPANFDCRKTPGVVVQKSDLQFWEIDRHFLLPRDSKVTKFISIAPILLLMFVVTLVHAQLYEHPFNLHQLPRGQVSVAAGSEFVNDRVALVGTLEYGALENMEGFLKGGELFFDDEGYTTKSPISFLYSGLSSRRSLWQTNWEHLASASLFASFANEKTEKRNRTLGVSGGLMILRDLSLPSLPTISPYVGVFYDMSWWTLGDQTSRGSAFSGQISHVLSRRALPMRSSRASGTGGCS